MKAQIRPLPPNLEMEIDGLGDWCSLDEPASSFQMRLEYEPVEA